MISKEQWKNYYIDRFYGDMKYFQRYTNHVLSNKTDYIVNFIDEEYGNQFNTYFCLAMCIGNQND